MLPVSFVTSVQPYRDQLPGSSEAVSRIIVDARLDGIAFEAILDTGASYCVLNWSVAEQVSHLLEGGEIEVRAPGGNVHAGRLFEVTLVLPAGEGDDVLVDTFAWTSETFHGPSLIGYGGLLEKIRFAADPARNLFYFGAGS